MLGEKVSEEAFDLVYSQLAKKWKAQGLEPNSPEFAQELTYQYEQMRQRCQDSK